MPEKPVREQNPSSTTDILVENISTYIGKIYKRRLAYLFAGPSNSWCEEKSGKHIELSVDPQKRDSKKGKFTGCRKYSTCQLIDERVRWRAWENLTSEEQDDLTNIGCYRATRLKWDEEKQDFILSSHGGWDTAALRSRSTLRKNNTPYANWISNPFAIRTKMTSEIIEKARKHGRSKDLSKHRDIHSCPSGGCVTPEIERDYKLENPVQQNPTSWKKFEACPFYFRHETNRMDRARPNMKRFVQCYVTLDKVRNDKNSSFDLDGLGAFLKNAGVIAAAPLFRQFSSTSASTDSFWYSFFSGYSFIQMIPYSEADLKAFKLLEPSLRWQATQLSRQHTSFRRENNPVLETLNRKDLLVNWERQERLLSSSEGLCSFFLLLWVLIQRVKKLIDNDLEEFSFSSLKEAFTWEFSREEDPKDLLTSLKNLDFEIEKHFALSFEVGSIIRKSSLEDDLQLLGLIDMERKPTARFEFCKKWLASRMKAVVSNQNSFASTLKNFLQPGNSFFSNIESDFESSTDPVINLCLGILQIIFGDHGTVTKDNVSVNDRSKLLEQLEDLSKKVEGYTKLTPKLHLLVRAYSPVPIRWLFLPMWEKESFLNRESELAPESLGGLILLLEDNLESISYRANWADCREPDIIMETVRNLFPLFESIFRVEESLVRDSLILDKVNWDNKRKDSENYGHFIATLKKDLSFVKDHPSSKYINNLLSMLDGYFRVPAEGSNPSDDSGVILNIVPVIKAAVDDRRAFYDFKQDVLRKQPKISFSKVELNFDCGRDDQINAKIYPISRFYKNENGSKRKEKIKENLHYFVTDIIIQREIHNEQNITLRVNKSESQNVVVEVIVEPFDFKWNSSEVGLDFFPVGRGWHTTFSIAKQLGSVHQSISNEPDKSGTMRGVIRFVFEGE